LTSRLPDFQHLIMMIPAVLMAFTFHEFGHAWVATLLGDDTPRLQGRLTLSPLAHLDPMGTLLIFLAGFGWAKPVQVNTSKLRPRVWGDIAVSLAGVGMNLILALVFYFLTVLGYKGLLFGYYNDVLNETLFEVVWINVVLIGFNLIPLPPLDGFHVARYLFPRSAGGVVDTIQRMGPFILMLLFITPYAGAFLRPILDGILSGVHAVVYPVVRLLFPSVL